MRKIDKYLFLLALPAVAYLVTFTVYPILHNFFLSFEEQDIYGNLHWVGLGNYEWFKKDPYFPNIVGNTLLYSLATPILDVLLAIPLAVMVKRLGGRWLLLIMIPAFIPPVTSATAWYLFLNPSFGIGYYLMQWGIIKTNLMASKWTIVLVNVWWTLPTAVLLIYSGLKSIPKSIEDAAHADGVAGPRKLFMIDLPLIAPQVLTAFVLTMLSGLFTFVPIYIGASQAGPRILDNLVYYAFDKFFSGQPGYAAALIVVMTALSTVLSMFYVKFLTSRAFVRLPAPSFLPSKELPKKVHYALLVALLAFTFIPFFWLVSLSFKSPLELIRIPPSIFPEHPILGNYWNAVVGGLPFLMTSGAVAVINTLITVLLASMLSYTMAIHRLGGRKLLAYNLYLNATPTIIYIIPLYFILKVLGILNSWWGLILTYPVMTLPYNSWILYNYFTNFPKQMEDAALMDGMNRFKAFFKVILPLSRNGLSVAAVYAFLFSWGALIFPLAFTYTPYDLGNPLSFRGAQTYSVYISMLMSPTTRGYGTVSAAGIISIIPSLTLLFLVRRNLERFWGSR
ncbi:MAG: ABC transporter permease subunit [Desulfurococcales archaeon]|nr:ABC transporter permease subunit [Desulfurococcales archaeon]